MKKLVVYVHSLEAPTIGFVDKEGAMHACAQAQKTAFKGLEQVSSILGNRYLPDDERKALMMLEGFCEHSNLEREIIDLGTAGFWTRLKARTKGLKTPAISFGQKLFCGVPSEKELQELLKAEETC